MVTRKYVRKIPRLRRLRVAHRVLEMAKGSTNFFSTTIYYDGNQSISVERVNQFSSFVQPKFWLCVVFVIECTPTMQDSDFILLFSCSQPYEGVNSYTFCFVICTTHSIKENNLSFLLS
jgi:hypothetical protein